MELNQIKFKDRLNLYSKEDNRLQLIVDGTCIYETIIEDENDYWNFFYERDDIWVKNFGRVKRENGLVNQEDFHKYVDKHNPSFKFLLDETCEKAKSNVHKYILDKYDHI